MVGNDGKTLDDVKEHVSLSHLLILTITWAGLANIGLIAPLFRHTIFAYYLHSVIMWLVVIFTLVGSFLPIVGEGGQLHEGE